MPKQVEHPFGHYLERNIEANWQRFADISNKHAISIVRR